MKTRSRFEEPWVSGLESSRHPIPPSALSLRPIESSGNEGIPQASGRNASRSSSSRRRSMSITFSFGSCLLVWMYGTNTLLPCLKAWRTILCVATSLPGIDKNMLSDCALMYAARFRHFDVMIEAGRSQYRLASAPDPADTVRQPLRC